LTKSKIVKSDIRFKKNQLFFLNHMMLYTIRSVFSRRIFYPFRRFSPKY